MINKLELDKYIEKIPPKPDIIIKVIEQVEAGNLKKGAEIAREDPILVRYMQNLINKPIFGFRKTVTDIVQIFALFGIDHVHELLHHYLLTLMSPKKWRIFKLNDNSFRDLQAELSFYWGRILEFENIQNREMALAISLLPLSIIVCDELFHSYKNEISLLEDTSTIDYDFLLHKLTEVRLSELSARIGNFWGFPKTALDILLASSPNYRNNNYNFQNLVKNIDKNKLPVSELEKLERLEKINRLGRWMHLVFFYVLSKPLFINSNLNTFIKFDTEYIEPIYQKFSELFLYEKNGNT